MKKNNALVKKSLRIPGDLVEYVETQPGADFSKKLVSILNEYREGDEERRRNIAAYDKFVAERRAMLMKLAQGINKLSALDRYVKDVLQEVETGSR